MLKEAKSLKTSSRDYQAQVHSDHIVSMIAKQDAGPRERRLNSRATFSEYTQLRVESGSLNKSQLTLSFGVPMKGERLSVRMMMMVENQSS